MEASFFSDSPSSSSLLSQLKQPTSETRRFRAGSGDYLLPANDAAAAAAASVSGISDSSESRSRKTRSRLMAGKGRGRKWHHLREVAAADSLTRLSRSLAKDRVVLVLSTGLFLTLVLAFWSQLPEATKKYGKRVGPWKAAAALQSLPARVWKGIRDVPRHIRTSPFQKKNKDTKSGKEDSSRLFHVFMGGLRVVAPPFALDELQEATTTFNKNSFTFSKRPDYNGLHMRFHDNPQEQQQREVQRIIWDMTTGPGPRYRDSKHEKHFSYYYNFDDEYQRTPYQGYENAKFYEGQACRSTTLHKKFDFPVCNLFHELAVDALTRSGELGLSGGGEFRQVFSVEQHSSGEQYVVKSGTFSDSDDFTFVEMDWYRRDGVISAATGPHPLLVDLYGYCAISLVSELLELGDAQRTVTHERCFDQKHPIQLETAPRPPFSTNNLTAAQKLQYALDMAEGLALLHNNPNGIIVHDDIQLCQYLLASNGHLKLNDYNRAEIMMYDPNRHTYCKYRNGDAPGDFSGEHQRSIGTSLWTK